MSYRYDPSRAALLTPAKGAVFFPTGRPATESALCAEMSRLAYIPFDLEPDAPNRLRETLLRVGFSLAHFFSSGGTQGFLAIDQQHPVSVLAFRGTERNPGDWRTILRAWRHAWVNGGRVHAGFAAALATVWDDLAPRLAELPGRKLYTGHSLGAALATLAASRHSPDVLYTFGSPRVGDERFLETLSGVESHRFTNCCDIICRLPLKALGYHHLGPSSYLDRQGAVHVRPGHGEVIRDRIWARLAYTWRWAWCPDALWVRDLADHSPVNYFSALSRPADGA